MFERLTDDDWATNELPEVFAMLGPTTLPHLQTFLATTEKDDLARVSAAKAIERIGQRHQAAAGACVGILNDQLALHGAQPPHVNGFLIANLVHLNATETIETIRDAFNRNNVDYSIIGDVEEVQLELGLCTERSTPRPNAGSLDRPALDETAATPSAMASQNRSQRTLSLR